jgi:hypothetical protein
MRATLENGRPEIRRFAARVRRGFFVARWAEGALFTAVVFAAVLLVLRLFGQSVEPSPYWLLLLVVPTAWASVHALRVGFGGAASAVHLDRRLGLAGLLLTARERDTGPWEGALREGLQRAGQAMPHLRGKRTLARILPAALLVAAMAFLPPIEEDAAAPSPLVADALEAFAEKLERLREEGAIREEVAEEMSQRIDEARERADRGEVNWDDVDVVNDRLEHERIQAAGRLAKLRAALGELSQGGEGAGKSPKDAEAAAALLRQAAASGLLDELPEGLLERLGIDAQSPEDSATSLSDATLRQLAAALSEAAGDQLDGLTDAGLLGEQELQELRDLMAGDPLAELEGEPCAFCPEGERDEDCPG